MRKLTVGTVILILIFALTMYAAAGYAAKTEILIDHILAASLLCGSGDWSDALIILENALAKWESTAGKYSMAMHQSELDEITMAFYDYMDHIKGEHRDDLLKRDKLIYSLEKSAKQESLSLRSIF